MRDAALSGLGIAYLPDFLVTEDLAAGHPKQVLADVEGEEVRIVTLYPNKRLLEPRVRRFIDLMVEELGS
ncbi:LysR substrate-binding domain-containing protein [Serratia grimesii]|uniref:LysR substrate-binding domain-containing protein n=1 Tax=Serratia grimesii TaxID=82995 RepID=UPI0039B10F5A